MSEPTSGQERLTREQGEAESRRRIGGHDVEFIIEHGAEVDEPLPDEVAHPDSKKGS